MLSEKHYVYMMIMSDKPSSKSDTTVPGTVMVQLLESDTKKPVKQKITNGLAEAFDGWKKDTKRWKNWKEK